MVRSIRKDQRGSIVGAVISLIFGFIITVLALRLVLRFFGANTSNEIVSWIYGVSRPFIEPFFGIFNTSSLDVGTGRFEVETFIALIVYAVIASLLTGLFSRGRRYAEI